MQKHFIDTKSPKAKFLDHIEPHHNQNIIFSGRYGIGKSYFINDFFNDAITMREYIPIKISPLHYVVSNNRTVFELIKYDILKFILEKYSMNALELDFEKDSIPDSLKIQFHILNKVSDGNLGVLQNIIGSWDLTNPFTQVAIPVTVLLGKILKQYKEYSKNIDDIQENENELYKIKSFVDDFKGEKGSPIEFNVISQILNHLLKVIKEKTGKKIVLVIDDLDRIDPDHMFRILNIFSAHNNQGEHGGNKFGFDKIILVCDIKSIENYFHEKYGPKAPFEGYIDKFCSDKFFHFENDDAIEYFLDKNYETSISSEALILLKFIVKGLLKCEILSLRQIIKSTQITKVPRYNIRLSSGEYISSSNLIVSEIVEVFSVIFKDINSFFKVIEEKHGKITTSKFWSELLIINKNLTSESLLTEVIKCTFFLENIRTQNFPLPIKISAQTGQTSSMALPYTITNHSGEKDVEHCLFDTNIFNYSSSSGLKVLSFGHYFDLLRRYITLIKKSSLNLEYLS